MHLLHACSAYTANIRNTKLNKKNLEFQSRNACYLNEPDFSMEQFDVLSKIEANNAEIEKLQKYLIPPLSSL